jgi:hypothetical protein
LATPHYFPLQEELPRGQETRPFTDLEGALQPSISVFSAQIMTRMQPAAEFADQMRFSSAQPDFSGAQPDFSWA